MKDKILNCKQYHESHHGMHAHPYYAIACKFPVASLVLKKSFGQCSARSLLSHQTLEDEASRHTIAWTLRSDAQKQPKSRGTLKRETPTTNTSGLSMAGLLLHLSIPRVLGSEEIEDPKS